MYLEEPVEWHPPEEQVEAELENWEEAEHHPIGEPLSVIVFRHRFDCLHPATTQHIIRYSCNMYSTICRGNKSLCNANILYSKCIQYCVIRMECNYIGLRLRCLTAASEAVYRLHGCDTTRRINKRRLKFARAVAPRLTQCKAMQCMAWHGKWQRGRRALIEERQHCITRWDSRLPELNSVYLSIAVNAAPSRKI